MSHSLLISVFPTCPSGGRLLCTPQPSRLLSQADDKGHREPAFFTSGLGRQMLAAHGTPPEKGPQWLLVGCWGFPLSRETGRRLGQSNHLQSGAGPWLGGSSCDRGRRSIGSFLLVRTEASVLRHYGDSRRWPEAGVNKALDLLLPPLQVTQEQTASLSLSGTTRL